MESLHSRKKLRRRHSKIWGYYHKSFVYNYWSFYHYWFYWRKRKSQDSKIWWLDVLETLGTLDQESKEKLQSSSSKLEQQNDIVSLLTMISTFCYSILRIAIIVTSYFTAPFIVYFWLGLPFQPFTSLYFWSFLFFGCLGLFPLVVRGIFLHIFHIDVLNIIFVLNRWPQWFFLSYVGIIILFKIFSFEHITYPTLYPPALFGAVEIMIGLFIITLMRTFYYNWSWSHFSHYFVLSSLIVLLNNVVRYYHKHELEEIEYKRQQLTTLEATAQIIERSLSPGSVYLDASTKVWFQERTRKIATALREKKKLILLPSRDDEKIFTEKMMAAFIAILNDDWDALEQIEIEKPPQVPQKWQATVLSWLKGIVIALLPIAAFLILQQTQWAVTSPVRDYVIVGLFIWSLLSLLSVIDPSIGARITAFKDATNLSNLLSPPSKGSNP